TFNHPFTPKGATTRPITSRLLGGSCGLRTRLHQPRDGGRELRALAGPVGEPLAVEAETFPALRRLGMVKTDAFDEPAGRGEVRVGGDDVVERPLLGAAASQANHNHGRSPGAEKGAILRELGSDW